MHGTLHKIIPALWVIWVIYWIISASRTKTDEQRESRPSRLLHYSLFLAGGAILISPNLLPPVFSKRQFTEYEAVYWLSAALVALGLCISCFARASLGTNWSAPVTLKHGHELIRQGPYRYVRHPIYTGLLLAIFGTALETGAWRGAIAFALITLGVLYKYKTEEQFLTRKFGDEYRRYQAEVPALVPGWP